MHRRDLFKRLIGAAVAVRAVPASRFIFDADGDLYAGADQPPRGTRQYYESALLDGRIKWSFSEIDGDDLHWTWPQGRFSFALSAAMSVIPCIGERVSVRCGGVTATGTVVSVKDYGGAGRLVTAVHHYYVLDDPNLRTLDAPIF